MEQRKVAQKYVPLTNEEIKRLVTEEYLKDFNENFLPEFQKIPLELGINIDLHFRLYFKDPPSDFTDLGKISEEIKQLIFLFHISQRILSKRIIELNRAHGRTNKISSLKLDIHNHEIRHLLIYEVILLNLRIEFPQISPGVEFVISKHGHVFVKKN